MTAQPLVSIVAACHKGRRFLAEVIAGCLARTHRDLEVIILNDASPGNNEVRSNCFVRYISH